MSARHRILVLGGSGHFGARIARRLGCDRSIELLIAGRDTARLESVAARLQAESGIDTTTVTLDHHERSFPTRLAELAPRVVVHSAGPFQAQDYRVAQICLDNTIDYVDLADGRKFVANFRSLDEQARAAGVRLITGASTLPGLSSAVVEHIRPRFATLESIETAIVPGNQTPRGLSTVRAILSYCGHPLRWLRDGRWETVHGWQDLQSHHYPRLGRRWLGACDVPDLTLFAERYPSLTTLTFHAGVELGWQQLGLWVMAAVTRTGMVKSWSPFARHLRTIGDWFGNRGSGSGAMHMRFTGRKQDDSPLDLTWYLIAHQNHGPEIPTIPATILARRLALSDDIEPSARSCLGENSLEDFTQEIGDLDVSWSLS